MKYRSDIDGLRALAVIPVVAFHGGIAGFGGGFTGVDIFFVISGFLLTGILIRELDDGRFTLSGFYVRRARRILPAVTVMVLVTLVVGFYLLAPSQFAQTAQAARGVATISVNHYFARIQSDYWDQNSLADQPLLHTWSLAVEEQFYIGLPLLLWFLFWVGTSVQADQAKKQRMAIVALAFIAVSSLVYAQWLLKVRPGDAFYHVLSRAWELIVGSLLAIGLHHRATSAMPWVRDGAGWLGLALIVASVTLLDEQMPFPGITALLPCLGAALVIWSGSVGQGSVQRLLSLSVLVWIGKISYSLYLWHWPVLVLVNSVGWYAWGLPHIPVSLQFTTIVLLAWWSWRFIEQPFRRGPVPVRKFSRILGASAATLVALWVSGATAERIAEGGSFITMPTPPLVFQLERDRITTPGIRCEGSADPNIIREHGGGCIVGVGSEVPRFVLLGDSHARMYSEGLDVLMRTQSNNALIMARSSCVPLIGFEPPTRRECRELTQASVDFLIRSNIPLVALAGYWLDLAQDDNQARILKQGLEKTVSLLRSSGKQVVLVMDVPELKDDLHAYRAAVESVKAGGGAVFGVTREDHMKNQRRVYQLLDEVAEKYELTLINPADFMCGAEGCLIAQEGRSLYRDKHHITDNAAIYYRNIFMPLLF